MESITRENGAARLKLEQVIAVGKASGAATLERIRANVPHDDIVRAGAFRFVPRPDWTVEDRTGKPIVSGYNVQMQYGQNGSAFTLHKHAFGQLAERAGVPAAYLGELATSTESWQQQLALRVLNDHMHAGRGNDRMLVRSVRGEVRGLLSDKYRRLDSFPLISAFAEECEKLGAAPAGDARHPAGYVSDTRVALKVILPTIFEPVPGEALAVGVEWFNSDYGAGKYGLRSFLLRLVCLNGAVREDDFSQVHLGGRLTDEIQYSDRTLRLDTAATESATRDHVRALLNPKRAEQSIAAIRSANEKGIDWAHARTRLGKALLKGELEAVKNAFEGPDCVNLPPAQTEWRLSNAVSWIAGATEDADRRLELERVAGSFFAPEKQAA